MSGSQEFNSRLLSGERIVWTGRPQQGVMFTSRDVFLIPFSLLWCAFVMFWEASVLSMGVARAGGIGLVFPLWGGAFVLVGLYFVAGRFIHDAWIRSRIRYALTDRRALILRGDRLTVVDLKRQGTIELKGGDGRGTIVFGVEPGLFGAGPWRGFGIWLPSLGGPPSFLGIDDAKSVFNRIEAVRAAA
jgi:hypothetical protein